MDLRRDANDHDTGNEPDHAHNHSFEWPDIARIAFITLVSGVVWLRPWQSLPVVDLLAAGTLLIGGWPIFKEALENLVARRMTMELSMSIAIVAAASISELLTALVITLFVLIAEVLEGMTVSRGRRAIRDLLDFLPRVVSVRRAGAVDEVSTESLEIGEAVLVNPGGRIPVDGAVIGGHSFVDESRITGESMPVEKLPGASVYAGSINQSGALEIRVERVGRDTSFGKIIDAVERAEHSRAPVQRLADRMAGYLVYFALGAAALTYVITRDPRSTISVIIVAGACGIAAGTPLAILGAIGRAARAGAVIKGGLFLEQLGQADTVVMDKTGTLTGGHPSVRALLPANGIDQTALLDAAACGEMRSEHPIGKTIVSYAKTLGRTVREPEHFEYTPGRGIAASLDGDRILVGNLALMTDKGITVPDELSVDYPEASTVFVTRAGLVLGAIIVADSVRSEAGAATAAMRGMGIQTVLLTGDTRVVADAIGTELGITEVAAELLPDEKRRYVKGLVDSGRTVAMVGDGVNDAPALIEAHVGVAMGSGTDVARESADVVLLGNDLVKFAETLMLARRTRRIIWVNFAGTIGVDVLGIGLAAFGFLNPMLAAFIHVTSELAFILNSARLLPGRIDRTREAHVLPERVGATESAS